MDRRSADFANAVRDQRYRNLSQKVEERYWPWQKVRYKAQEEKLDPEMLWLFVKLGRGPKMRFLPLHGERGAAIGFNTPDVLQEELMLIDQQLAARVISVDDQPLSAANQERFIITALREEAIASSMLEGAATTRHDAKRMLASGRTPRTRGERMVLNNYEAMTYVREHRNSPLTPEFLLDIQSMLTAGTLDDSKQCGRFRTEADPIDIADQYGNVQHTPPPASELPNRLQELCDFGNGKSAFKHFVHPVIRACALHFQVGFEHPFCDGNGRTARTIFYWAMLRAGYWLFEYLPISRLIYAGPSKYALAFLYTETDEFDLTYFLVYKAKVISRARKDLLEYIADKQKEIAAGRQVYESDHRLNHRQRDVILRVLRNPGKSTTIMEHRDRFQVAYGTARNDLKKLEEWGYLISRVSGKQFEFVRGKTVENQEKTDP